MTSTDTSPAMGAFDAIPLDVERLEVADKPKLPQGWIIPYLPETFTTNDYWARSSITDMGACRAYLDRLVAMGRLIKLSGDDNTAAADHHYAREGWHLRRIYYQGGKPTKFGGRPAKEE